MFRVPIVGIRMKVCCLTQLPPISKCKFHDFSSLIKYHRVRKRESNRIRFSIFSPAQIGQAIEMAIHFRLFDCFYVQMCVLFRSRIISYTSICIEAIGLILFSCIGSPFIAVISSIQFKRIIIFNEMSSVPNRIKIMRKSVELSFYFVCFTCEFVYSFFLSFLSSILLLCIFLFLLLYSS